MKKEALGKNQLYGHKSGENLICMKFLNKLFEKLVQTSKKKVSKPTDGKPIVNIQIAETG